MVDRGISPVVGSPIRYICDRPTCDPDEVVSLWGDLFRCALNAILNAWILWKEYDSRKRTTLR